MEYNEVIEKIKGMGSQKNREGMARFGINTEKAYGVAIYKLRPMAK